jgi:hypothetical protein
MKKVEQIAIGRVAVLTTESGVQNHMTHDRIIRTLEQAKGNQSTMRQLRHLVTTYTANVSDEAVLEEIANAVLHGKMTLRSVGYGAGAIPDNPCQYSGNAPSPEFYERLGQANRVLGLIIPVRVDPIEFVLFARGFPLDAQEGHWGSGKSYDGSTAYANYVFGVYCSAAGYSLPAALFMANVYARFCTNGYPMLLPSDMGGPTYLYVPKSNIANITAGYNAQQSGTLCKKDK